MITHIAGGAVCLRIPRATKGLWESHFGGVRSPSTGRASLRLGQSEKRWRSLVRRILSQDDLRGFRTAPLETIGMVHEGSVLTLRLLAVQRRFWSFWNVLVRAYFVRGGVLDVMYVTQH